jgi:hypothetical protein
MDNSPETDNSVEAKPTVALGYLLVTITQNINPRPATINVDSIR